MSNIFIIHGAYGSPDENWIPWLKGQLEADGHTVVAPRFPTPEGQNLDAWLEVFDAYRNQLDEESVVIGHSLGPAFLMRILEKLPHSIKASFFIAGFTQLLGDPTFDDINQSFLTSPFDWQVIKKNCGQCTVFHSDNDPYVPLEFGKEIADHLDAEFIEVPGAGHFNTDAGYSEFEELLEKVRSL